MQIIKILSNHFLTKLEKDCINNIVETGKSPAFTGVPIRDSNINLAY